MTALAPAHPVPSERRQQAVLRRSVRGLARGVDLAVGVGFVVAYAARYVRPEALTWPLQLAAPLLPYLALALLALTAGRLRGMRRWSVVGHAALFALAVVRFAPGTFARADAGAGDLRVVTYNVPRWSGPESADKARAIVAFAARERPDVIAFQEPVVVYSAARERVAVSPFLEALRDSLGYRVGRTAFARARRSPQPVFTRFRVQRADEIRFRRAADAAYTYVTRVAFRHAGRDAVLYNLHLYTHGARKPWKEPGFDPFAPASWAPFLAQYRDAHRYRAWEADTLRALLDAEVRPAIVVGDFNASPHDWAFARVAGARGGLTDAFRQAGRGWGATYHRRLPLVRIDHVLASREWTVVRARVPAVGASDHRPVEAVLRWRTATDSTRAAGAVSADTVGARR